jgi:2-polyprenyl-3-methyl-5-hydroxy-6-metoxy-1,4-benzoquinol methylase
VIEFAGSKEPLMAATETSLIAQQEFWNRWNATNREADPGPISHAQAAVVARWLARLGRRDMTIMEVGCGTGWMAERLAAFGQVTATDLSDEVLARAAVRAPTVKFVAGDFMQLPFPAAEANVVVCLEVLSHVPDQPQFVAKLASLLRPGGTLMLATQNGPALRRNVVAPPRPGQLRRWVDRRELRELLRNDFELDELFTIDPRFNRGLLRYAHSQKLAATGLDGIVRTILARCGLGWTLMALARRRL